MSNQPSGQNRHKRPSRARSVALGGIFSALALMILLAGGFIPIGTFAAPIFAGICLLPISIELGTKWALLCYLAVSGLALLFVPDQELVLFFILLLGYYPFLRPVLDKIKNRVLRTALKLLMFNGAVAAVYAILLLLFVSPGLQQELAERGLWFWGVLLLLGNFTFVLYDILLDKVRIIYFARVRRFLVK